MDATADLLRCIISPGRSLGVDSTLLAKEESSPLIPSSKVSSQASPMFGSPITSTDTRGVWRT